MIIARWFTPEEASFDDPQLWSRCLDATGRAETTTDPTYGDTTVDFVHDAELAATLFSLHRMRPRSK